jgi:hypothetical protein
VNSKNTGWHIHDEQDRKWDGEGTFAGSRGNDGVAAERNAGVPPDMRLEFRIGINLGDIIHDERDIFGNGVNVAARLEALAEPGGICISRSVRDPVQDTLRFTFEDIGEQTLKNISVPVHAYRVRFGGADPRQRAVAPFRPRRHHHPFASLAVGLGVVCAAAIVALLAWPWHPPRPIAPQPLADARRARARLVEH